MRNITIIITIATILSSCAYQPEEFSSETAAQHADALPGVRTLKIPHMAPFVGGQGASPHVIIDYRPEDENFPGWTAPIQIEQGTAIVGGRAWVSMVTGSMRLALGTNTQVVGQELPRGGVEPVVFSPPSAPGRPVQILSFAGQRIPAVSGTTYYLSVQSVAQQGTRGVAQLLALELDITNALAPQ